MKINSKLCLVMASLAMLAGCSSNNIRPFSAETLTKHDLARLPIGKVHVSQVLMPKDDTDSILCRAVGNIYLPNKMTYSSYIKDAFDKSLASVDKYADTPAGGHSLNVTLREVTFNSLAGEWTIHGDVVVDNKPSVKIDSITQYGTAYIAETACRNTSDAFDGAAADFVKKVLTHPEISKNLK